MGTWKLFGRIYTLLAMGGGCVILASTTWKTEVVYLNVDFPTSNEMSVPIVPSELHAFPKNQTSFEIKQTFRSPTIPSPPPSVDGRPRNHSIIYVHIGKTGGISLDKVLTSNCMWYAGGTKRRKCLKELSRSSMLSELTKATLHFGPRRDYNDWIQNATIFLVTLRNPISRAVSAFNFDHPRNNNPSLYTTGMPESLRHFFVQCFPTIQHLADLIDIVEHHQGFPSDDQRTCYDTAKKTLAGNGPSDGAAHLKMNYQFYYQLSMAYYPERPVLVIRTEHLWNDLLKIDQMLGGSGHLDHVGSVYTHGSQSHVVSQGLSTRGKQIVCCYLAREMHVYETLLRRAVNLIASEIHETIAEVYDQCGMTSNSSIQWDDWAHVTCPMATAYN